VLAGAKLVSDEILAKLRMESKSMDRGEVATMKEEYRVMGKWRVPLKSHLDVQTKTAYSVWLQWWVPVFLALVAFYLWTGTSQGVSVLS
jgi:phytoene desaturase (3,4-didehydrolycopene-forming)